MESLEIKILSYLVYSANGIISFIYTEKFLQLKFERRKLSLLLWTLIYSAIQIAMNVMSTFYTYNSFVNMIPSIILLFALQMIFFERNRLRQIFVLASFTAGWEILRFTASPLAYILYNLWSPLFIWLINDWAINQDFIVLNLSMETILKLIEGINRFINVIIISICRAIQIFLLVLYLKLIVKHFPRRDYELNLNESLFLILPCVTVFIVDLTVRLMAISVDNGALHLIYSRVPETALLLPVVSLFLLAIVIISVKLFNNLIKFKDEEQKRILLENRVVEVHKEIEDLSNVYSDIRGLKHDLRDHIANITAYVRSKLADEEMNEYLNRMTQTVEKLDFYYKTGNPIVDIILHQNLQQARKKNIRFEADFHCPKNFQLDIYDLSIILNNALKNAIEASEKLIDSAIYIRSYTKGNFYFIEIENDFDDNIIFNEEALPLTTKKNKSRHGIGLYNIRKCAQKYNGDIDIELKDGKFNLTVMMNLVKS